MCKWPKSHMRLLVPQLLDQADIPDNTSVDWICNTQVARSKFFS